MSEQKLLKILDYFVLNEFSKDSNTLHSARILAGVLLAYTLLLLFASAAIFLLSLDTDSNLRLVASSQTLHGFELGAIITLGISFIFCGLLCWLKYASHYRLVCRATCLVEFVIVILVICVTDGPINSHATQLIIVPCIKAFCLMGTRAGFKWSLATLVALVTLEVLGVNGTTFIDMTDPNYHVETRSVISIVSFLSLLVIVIIYEFITQRVKEEGEREYKHYIHLAEHDPLTELANRNYFEQRITAATVSQQRRNHGEITGLLYIDLDNFKPINDNYGHAIGDDVLKMVAKRLGLCVRNSDTVARIGGDEFAIILADLHNKEEITPIAHKIVQQLKEPFYVDNFKVSISASVGAALYPLHTDCPNKLKKFADVAMYSAKANRNQWRLFTDDMLHKKKRSYTRAKPVFEF